MHTNINTCCSKNVVRQTDTHTTWLARLHKYTHTSSTPGYSQFSGDTSLQSGTLAHTNTPLCSPRLHKHTQSSKYMSHIHKYKTCLLTALDGRVYFVETAVLHIVLQDIAWSTCCLVANWYASCFATCFVENFLCSIFVDECCTNCMVFFFNLTLFICVTY